MTKDNYDIVINSHNLSRNIYHTLIRSWLTTEIYVDNVNMNLKHYLT